MLDGPSKKMIQADSSLCQQPSLALLFKLTCQNYLRFLNSFLQQGRYFKSKQWSCNRQFDQWVTTEGAEIPCTSLNRDNDVAVIVLMLRDFIVGFPSIAAVDRAGDILMVNSRSLVMFTQTTQCSVFQFEPVLCQHPPPSIDLWIGTLLHEVNVGCDVRIKKL